MLDILYIALTLALFALVSLAASGADRLGPRVRVATRPDSTRHDAARTGSVPGTDSAVEEARP